jgi:hypothetical protein
MTAITTANIGSPVVAEILTSRATRAYLRSCEREGCEPQQPCAVSSKFDPETMRVTLANVRGTLAVYGYILDSDRLFRIDTTEEEP